MYSGYDASAVLHGMAHYVQSSTLLTSSRPTLDTAPFAAAASYGTSDATSFEILMNRNRTGSRYDIKDTRKIPCGA